MFFRDILLIILSFLSGSIMYSYLIPKLVKGIDIRKISDDMNPGSGNVIKYCGIPLGILCIILDLFKAFIPVFISINYFYTSNIAIIFIAISPILGHAYSPFLKFQGGKAIASTFGSFLDILVFASNSSIYIKLIVFLSSIILGHKHRVNRNDGDITISLFNKYCKKILYHNQIT